MGVVSVVCFIEKGSQNVLEGIITNTLIATSMEESLPVFFHTDTEVGVGRSLLQSTITKDKTQSPSLFWTEKKSLYKSLYLLNSPIAVN